VRGAADWIGRTLFLILAGLATYSMLLSILSISAEIRHSATPGAPDAPVTRERPVRPATPERPIDPTRIVPDAKRQSAGTASGEPVIAAAMPDMADDDLRRWAEALTWAVLALAGFAAATMIVLLKITAQLARIADGRQR
jgi:hypothetical protein